MGGSSSEQVIGYKYYAGLMVALGNRIEKLNSIRPDNRAWIPINSVGNEPVFINKPDLFGGDKGEGGFQGFLDVHLGADDQLQNEYLAAQDISSVSAYPGLSYVVYRGVDVLTDPMTGNDLFVGSLDKGFQLVSMSGMLKEVLYWPKRIHIKDDGSEQWYDEKAEVPEGGGNKCFFVKGSYSHNGIYMSSLGTTSPLNLIDYSSAFRWSGSIQRGVQAFEYRFTHASDENETLTIRIQLNAATGLPNISTTGRVYLAPKGGVNVIKNDNNAGFWNIIVDYKFVIERGSAAAHSVNFSYAYSGEYKTSDDLSDFYFVGPLGINHRDGYICPIDSGDMNPIHKIREVLTDYTAMNKPESDVNDTNFIAAADRIWDEGLGISWAIQEKSCKEAIDELLYHIEAGIRVNRQTGKYEVILFRDDLLDLDNAMSFDESNIQDLDMEIATTDDLINVLNVSYYDRANITDSSFSVYENGNIRTLDQEIAESANFPYFMNRRNAELVANWKLKQLSTPTWKGTFTTGFYDARKLNRYDVIKLSWDNLGIVNLPVRVMKISLGDGIDNTVSIDFVEVIPYSSIDYQPVAVDPPTSAILPPQPNSSIAFEMPYFEGVQLLGQTQLDAELANNPDIGYLMVATKKPQNNSINALLYADDGTGYERESVVNYCPFAQLDQNIGYLDTSFALKNVDSISSASVGSVLMIDDEIMVYQSYDTATKVITVKRGALDTVPHLHSTDATLFFYDEYPSYLATQYVDSEIINAKVLTTTPSGVQSIDDATALPVEFNARMIRPYPPANFKINNQYFPVGVIGPISLSWDSRNRLQQTGGDVLGFQDGSVTPEEGTTYNVYAYNHATGELKYSATGITTLTHVLNVTALLGVSTVRLEVFSVRDGYLSYQAQHHVMEWSSGENLMIFEDSYTPDNGNAVVLQFIE